MQPTTKQIAITTVAMLLVWYLVTKNKPMKITATNKVRGCDLQGCGNFGAKRTDHVHEGTDFVTKPGDTIFTPIAGKVIRLAKPYAGTMNGIVIANDTEEIKIFYMNATVKVGQIVNAGQAIGIAQDITPVYGKNITNHVHAELRFSGHLQNIEKLI